MKNSIIIKKIAIDENGILSVKPRKESFDMIYRAAIGAYWDNENKNLYFATPVKQDSDVIEFYNLIITAVLSEYGKILKLDDKTIYENINESIKSKIVKL